MSIDEFIICLNECEHLKKVSDKEYEGNKFRFPHDFIIDYGNYRHLQHFVSVIPMSSCYVKIIIKIISNIDRPLVIARCNTYKDNGKYISKSSVIPLEDIKYVRWQ